MLRIWEAYGIPPRIVIEIETTYTVTAAKVVTLDGESEEFKIYAEVRYCGAKLAPFLFIIVLD